MRKTALLLLPCAWLLTGCAMVKQPPLPADLLVCAPAPTVPDTDSQATVGQYVVDLWAAGDDCRTKLAAIKQLTGN